MRTSSSSTGAKNTESAVITPFLWLSYMIWRGTTGKALIVGLTVCACLVLLSVFMMRWNVVIGGQEISKTGKGLLDYHAPMFGREGLITALSVFFAPMALLVVLIKFLPPWEHGEAPAPTSAR